MECISRGQEPERERGGEIKGGRDREVEWKKENISHRLTINNTETHFSAQR